jgi:outer membrane protein OmpA-like peptidoglycan-associated protein
MDKISEPVRVPPNIGYLDGKYKVCRENCPVPTPKELDDSVTAQLLAELLKKSKPVPLAQLVPQPVPKPIPIPVETPPVQPVTISTFDIYFNFGMSKPNIDGKKELLRFTESIQKNDNQQIELIGATDDIGSQTFNRKLAYKRALYVRKWLKSHGVNAQITIVTKEQCCRAAPYNKRELALKAKRKVSIISHSSD